jgi:CNT family concentrative nucleoside transporter
MVIEPGTWDERARAALGLLLFLVLAWGIGRRRGPTPVPWKTVGYGLALQLGLALLLLHTPVGRMLFEGVNHGVDALLSFSKEGATFVFGSLVNNNVAVGQPAGDPLMGPVTNASGYAGIGALFAFRILPTIIFFSALSALAYHLGLLGWVVRGFSWLMRRTMFTSGAETLSAAANVFLGPVEAPLIVRPFIAGTTRSELMAIMAGGFANIATGVLAAYAAMLSGLVPDAAAHLLTASVISAPASLVVAKLMLPETEVSETAGKETIRIPKTDVNALDAVARGTMEGLQLSLTVGAMLIVFIAGVAMLNALLAQAGGLVGLKGITFQGTLGALMAPFTWLTGLSWREAQSVGQLVGLKTVLNEFLAYLSLSEQLRAAPGALSGRSAVIATYLLCNFANFGSVGITIGGIAALAPERRGDLCRLGLYALLGGLIASFVGACIVGVLL